MADRARPALAGTRVELPLEEAMRHSGTMGLRPELRREHRLKGSLVQEA